jgi:hypothetical protein
MEEKVKEKVIDIEKLVQDAHNFNKGTDEGRKLMERSLSELGAGRSILIDRNDNIIAGNKTQEAALKAGIKRVRVIETTGDELVAVKRTDVDIDSAKGRELALADNLTTQVNLSWDQTELEAVQADVEGFDVGEWGFDIEDLPEVVMPIAGETEDEAIERKRREFEERMDAGELGEDDPEYQEFVKKFEVKKTTDDCYTPDVVYEAVADFVASEYNVSRANFVRPFYPGGDYQKERYKPTDIVVDNPPFSIIAEILKFYHGRGIRFFLFGPHLTLFSSFPSSFCTALPVGVTVTYANGANVNTSFLTNLEDSSIRFRSEPRLYAAIKKANEEKHQDITKQLPKYAYDHHIITVHFLSALSRLGIDFRVPVAESEPISQMDSQRESGKAIFGKGYIVSDRVFAEREKAEREKVEREKAEREKAERKRAEREKAEREKAERWELSERERGIIERLNKAGENRG